MSDALAFVAVPAAEFVLGQKGSISPAAIQRTVYVSAFEILSTPMTCGAVAQLDCRVSKEAARRAQILGPTTPLTEVTKGDAEVVCEALTRHTGRRHQLPTDAQWERAYRGGTTTTYFWGDRHEEAQRFAVFDATVELRAGMAVVPPVASRMANPLGLFDMAGLVREWVADSVTLRDDAPYPVDGTYDGLYRDPCTNSGPACILRNGGFTDPWPLLAASVKAFVPSTTAHRDIGFRVVREASR